MTAPTYPSTYPPTHPPAYPVHVDADLETGLNRWLWLVKWLLVIPHYIVLAFLWLAFAVLSVVAFFAILFTGRYPRGIFDFNVGVLRWSWRVAYYAYGALGTDRYPPFTLSEVPDYPAHLDVDYPEHLSRGLVLVKSWLLAIPHYLVIAFFLGGGWYLGSEATDDRTGSPLWSSGLITVLVVVAAVVLLFTGRYPQPIFDLVLGLNRWVIRVGAYASLMTDAYPPFRLDQGGPDPDGGRLELSTPSGELPAAAPVPPVPPVPGGGAAVAPPPRQRSGWTAGRVVSLVGGCLLLLVSLGLGAAGGVALVADQAVRDDAGFVMSDEELLTTDTYALVSEKITIHTDSAIVDLPEAILGDVRFEATGSGDSEIFVGVGPTADVADYLQGVRQAQVVELTEVNGDYQPIYEVSGQGPPSSPPADSDVWAAQATGTGTVTVDWSADDGDWTVVVMNADGQADVSADVAVGATLDWLGWLAVALLVAAGIGLVLSVLMVTLAVRRARS